MSNWMIYGANGYTGRLIAELAKNEGLTPTLAGRTVESVKRLADTLDLPHRAFALDDPDTVNRNLEGMDLVLHCAGPFSETSAPMLEACLQARAHYLDITGEIDVFAHCHAQDTRAAERGIVVIPGTGFDVVPTDCLAAMLKTKMPDAVSLVLAFDGGGGPSPGTAKTGVEGLAKGGRVRKDGNLKTVPLAWKSRYFVRDGQQRLAITIPWGDVFTAYVSTGIPDIEVYMTVPPSAAKRLRRLRLVQPLLGLGFVQRFMKKRIDKSVKGPSAERREKTGCTVWGEVTDAAGHVRRAMLTLPNGYSLTAEAALGIARRLLDDAPAQGGFRTPSQLMGADYVLGLKGVELQE
ncbi:MAG TPA: saccharopine dehydrogenase NADP-binding domain-containing protein [Xanthomonadaceae bacterium]|nr:saccharopine dehydrogenase NADP-binding domain-containing protein [Xanthomonadaceae bacterium]